MSYVNQFAHNAIFYGRQYGTAIYYTNLYKSSSFEVDYLIEY